MKNKLIIGSAAIALVVGGGLGFVIADQKADKTIQALEAQVASAQATQTAVDSELAAAQTHRSLCTEYVTFTGDFITMLEDTIDASTSKIQDPLEGDIAERYNEAAITFSQEYGTSKEVIRGLSEACSPSAG